MTTAVTLLVLDIFVALGDMDPDSSSIICTQFSQIISLNFN